MARFELSCIVLFAMVALAVEASLFNWSQWKEVDNYARANDDHDGHSLVEWYNRDFKDISAKRHYEYRLRSILELIIYHLGIGKPEDCDDKHLKQLFKFQDSGMSYGTPDGMQLKYLFWIYIDRSWKYSELCQQRVNNEFKKVIKTLDQAQVELVNKFTQTTLDKDGRLEEYYKMVDGMYTDTIKLNYLETQPRLGYFDTDALRAACKAYTSAISPVYKPLKAFLKKARFATFSRVEGVDEQRTGLISMVFCKTLLQSKRIE